MFPSKMKPFLSHLICSDKIQYYLQSTPFSSKRALPFKLSGKILLQNFMSCKSVFPSQIRTVNLLYIIDIKKLKIYIFFIPVRMGYI